MKQIFKYSILAGLAAVSVHAIWYFFWLKNFQPELFIGLLGLVFVMLGMALVPRRELLPKSNDYPNMVEVDPQLQLSPAEEEILELICQGYSNQQIADVRHVSINTVKTHVSNLFSKMGVNSRTQAIAMARKSKPPVS